MRRGSGRGGEEEQKPTNRLLGELKMFRKRKAVGMTVAAAVLAVIAVWRANERERVRMSADRERRRER